MNDLQTVRDHVEEIVRLAREDPRRVDAVEVAETALQLAVWLCNASDELLPLRDIVSDLDELMDGEAGDLFQPGHSCRVQRRMAQFYRERWKPNFAARGGTRTRQTWGRGR